MSVQQELGILSLDAIIQLFEVRISVSNIIYFCNSEQVGTADSPMLNGQAYIPWPIKVSNYKKSAKGKMVEPKIVFSNFNNIISAILLQNQPYNAEVVRHRIFAKHLDNGLSPNPLAEFPQENFFIDNWEINALTCTIRLVSPLKRLSNQIPKRRITSL